MRRDQVDQLAYAAKPYGEVDNERHPISNWLRGDNSANWGQARILAHPKLFMRPDTVRMRVASADPDFHRSRQRFQEELIGIFRDTLAEPSLFMSAATGIYGGTLPAWWAAKEKGEENDRHHSPSKCRPKCGYRY